MQRLLHFLRYDNTVPIVLGVIFLGATGTYAATNPEAVYSVQQHVLSVDNTYLADKDLSSWSPRAEITGVTEDEENYYVAYKFSTIDNVEYVWRDTVKEEVMTVSKADLGQYRDLGVYVTQQLKQKIDRELARLTETQEIERKQVSQKMVATAYGGIVGKFLDDTTETLPGYTPVVTKPADPEPVFSEALPPPPEIEPEEVVEPQPIPEIPNENATSTPAEGEQNENATSTPSELASTGLAIQILGNNPARVAVGGTYTDLGAVASNDANEELDVKVFVDGTEVESVTIDTATPATHTIRYEATDASGTKSASRTVEVYAPETPTPASAQPSASSTPPAAPAPTASPTPPTPAPASTTPSSTPTPATPPAEATPAAEEPEVDPVPEAQPEPTPEPAPSETPAE